jgi:hypothetical protein
MNYLKYAIYYLAADNREARKVAAKFAHDWIAENMQDEPRMSHKRTLVYQGLIKSYMNTYCTMEAKRRLNDERL